MTPEQHGGDAPICANGATSNAGPRPDAGTTRFESILFERPGGGLAIGREMPGFFGDLNLDQALKSMTAGREQYDLEPLFYTPLHDADAVAYRHEALCDLERPDIFDPVNGFAEAMRRMRQHREQAGKLHYKLQKQGWFLDAAEIYCQAVRELAEGLAAGGAASRGFSGFDRYLGDYVGSERFTSLAAQTQALKDALARIRYGLRIQGPRITVSRYDGEPDYGAEVEATFARFAQGAAKSYLLQFPGDAEMDHVEAQIVGLVARLYPDEFEELEGFCTRHAGYQDPVIGRFDREVQFYLAYLELIRRCGQAGLAFCYPEVSAGSKQTAVEGTFDIALADKLAPAGTVVVNDFRLTGPERVLVVSGPNNGGKTTFARAFGQLHYLASLGLPVPGRSARLFLPDRIFTHFEKEEDIETLRSKFEDELVRVHDIVRQATPDSVIVMNESFNSTTLDDALLVGTEVMRQILDLGCLGVYVTFVDEIASLSDATVSMVSQIESGNPAGRTFKVLRRPADGLAYAWAIAEKYGLTYERLLERIG